MPLKSLTPRGQRGMALILAVVITGICVVIAAGLMRYMLSEYQAAHLDWRQVQALYCAEAGVEYAMDALINGDAVADTEVTLVALGLEDAEGSFRVSTEEVTSAGLPDPEGDVRILATGFVPSEEEFLAGRGVSRSVVAVVGTGEWDFGSDAVRSRNGVKYGSNEYLTVGVDEDGEEDPDAGYAHIRVTGEGGEVRNTSSNKAHVAGRVYAPGQVDVEPGRTAGVSENNPENCIPDAFPDPATLGYDNSNPPKINVPPPPDTWAHDFYQEAVAGGTVYFSGGTPIQAPKFIDLWGIGTLSNVRLRGPGVIFVRGNLGGGIVNGPPAATVVITGSLNTGGNEVYRCDPGDELMAPPLIAFGPQHEIKGSSRWILNGPFYAMHPQGEVLLNDSAMGCVGALISNGSVHFKSSGAKLGFPSFLQNQRFIVRAGRHVRSYAAQ
ncbi:MAG TPA: hypothetical protein GX715_03780 [Armatimonadetes bacterium]|jgi:hypothetical protein|nr:hypothetical protein [Armatimonadota bacterium]